MTNRNASSLPQPRMSFTITVGCLIRGRVRQSIERYCLAHQIHCHTHENRGWLDSLYRFDLICADPHALEQAARDLNKWIESNKETP